MLRNDSSLRPFNQPMDSWPETSSEPSGENARAEADPGGILVPLADTLSALGQGLCLVATQPGKSLAAGRRIVPPDGPVADARREGLPVG